MKLLMIGMDGAHMGAFNRGWTPFIESLLQSQKQYEIKNDLYSRGWLEIATGQHSRETSAMYDKPKCGGTREWTAEFKFGDAITSKPETVPLWHAVNQAGYRVGIMNLPTTFPAPKVDGFFVSGGGGGAPVTETAVPELCHPKEVAAILENTGYIVDQRLYQLVVDKHKNNSELIFSQLAYKNQQRTNAFIELDAKYNVDFGFIVYKTSSVFAETFYTTEMVRQTNPKNHPDEHTLIALKDYYGKFDMEIKKLRQAYPDAQLIFVSDHGTEPRTHTVNPNILLEKMGLYTRNRSDSLLRNTVTKVKSLVPFSVKAVLKKKVSKNVQSVGTFDFDANKTKAFCKTYGDWRHGIFINDVERFGGCVQPSDKQQLVDAIVNAVNSHQASQEHGISAKPASQLGSNIGPWFPDVVFDLPDGYLTFDMATDYVVPFVPRASKTALQSIMRGDILSLKSHWPIVSTTMERNVATTERMDLTAPYDLVLSYFDRLESN